MLSRVIVVDNGSRPEEIELLKAAADGGLGLPLEMKFNSANEGFAAACNQGAAGGVAPFILFHNPDVVVLQDAVEAAAMALERGEANSIGIVGVRLVDGNGTVHRCSSRFPTPGAMAGQAMGLDRIGLVTPVRSTDWDHADTREVDQVMGAFLMVRRDVFEQLGGFDERFFVYYDDVDLSLRARQRGWRTLYLADATAVHDEQGTTQSAKAARLFYLLRSRLLYANKHFGWGGVLVVWSATLFIEPVARGINIISGGGRRQDLAALVRAYRLLFQSLPHLKRDARQAAP